jgi:thiol-disulfide isomerase/thioredoxin
MQTQLLIILIILIIILGFTFWKKIEKFGNNQDDVKILVFVSDTCPHCVSYKAKKNEQVKHDVEENGYKYDLINSSPETRDLFNKYDVQFIPTCVVVKNDKHVRLQGDINIDNIKDTLKDL